MALQLQDSVGDVYEYTSITEPGTIRVIKLLPSLDIEADLHCSLQYQRLDDFQDGVAGHYTALSYVWGDATDVRTIFVEGRRLAITASLHCALRHIRHTHHASYFWADGICINQDVVAERNIQVSMMGSIYKTAHRTIIFLGPSCASCNEVMESISSIASSAREFAATPEHREVLSKHILSHPWFTRVWTLQELVLSKNTWVQKGTARVPWEIFSQHVHEHCTDPADIQPITDLVAIKVGYWNPLQTSSFPSEYLYTILRQRRGAGVSDPRDMIFGHLGLCPPTHESIIRSSISIDYSRTLNELLEAVARQIILDTGELLPLAEVGTVQPEDRRIGLPSWVPDWTVSNKNEPALISGWERVSEIIHGHVSDIDTMFSTPHILGARGTYLGSIRTVLPRPKDLELGTRGTTQQELPSWAINKESQPIVHAVCTVVREICERLNFLMWGEEIATDDFHTSNSLLHFRVSELTGEDRQLITNLYITSQGANASGPEDSEILLHPEIADFLIETLQSVYCIARVSNATAISEYGEVVSVDSRAREGDLLCRLEGSSGFYVMRPCGKENDKDKNNRALVPVMGRSKRQAKGEKIQQCLDSVEAGRTGEEGVTRGMQMSIDVRLIDFVSTVGNLHSTDWWRFKFGEDFSPRDEAVFAIH